MDRRDIGALWSAMHDPNKGHQGEGSRNSELAATSKAELKTEYDARVAAEEREFTERFHLHLRQCLMLVMLSRGKMDDEGVDRVMDIYKQITEDDLSDEMIVAEREIQQHQDELFEGLGILTEMLSDGGRALIIKACILVGVVDEGSVSDEAWDVIITIAGALQMTEEEFQIVMNELTE